MIMVIHVIIDQFLKGGHARVGIKTLFLARAHLGLSLRCAWYYLRMNDRRGWDRKLRPTVHTPGKGSC
jgi:hypothetical protein